MFVDAAVLVCWLERVRLHRFTCLCACSFALAFALTNISWSNTWLLQVRGPPAKSAFAADGSPTKALEGFCKKNNVQLSDISKEADAKGVEYVWATVRDAGRPASEVRAHLLSS